MVMLELRNISKAFHGVHAVRNVSIVFNSGEVHALCGENGAGKSTLMNVIVGNLQPDAGELWWKGSLVSFNNISHAQKLGISIVYQEGSLCDSLSVAENIYPSHPPKTKLGVIDFSRLYRQATGLLSRLKISDINPKTLVSRLSAEQKKLVEIARAIAVNPSLLILDEPTASISSSKVETIFEVVRSLKKEGTAVIYISHRMDEIMRVSDRISVLKDGNYQGTLEPRQTTIDEVIRLMVGRELLQHDQGSGGVSTHVLLRSQNLTGREFRNVTFDLHKGEIFGMAGLQGSGRTALARTLFGDLPCRSGKVILNNADVNFNSPADAIAHGIAYIPEERKSMGLFLEKDIAENMAVSTMRNVWYDKSHLAEQAQKAVSTFTIKSKSIHQPVKMLSGGNQQKVVIAKWLATNPSLLIVNEPTHGVDVGAKAEIYQLLRNFVDSGKSILLISSDLPELLLLCDRIGVMYKGELTRIFNRDEASEQAIARAASGLQP
jgi:ribose transport system ATP-binding protein